jgi:phospholipase C
MRVIPELLLRLLSGRTSRVFKHPRIRHFFVLMLENRSYDHLFGYADIQGADGLDGPVPNTDRSGVSAATTFGAPDRLLRKERDPGHEFVDTMIQFCGASVASAADGVNDRLPKPYVAYPAIAAPDERGFLASYTDHRSSDPGLALRCFGSDDTLPVLRQLAREFVLCDRWFSSMPGPTWPNRLFAIAGTSGGLDHSPSTWEILKLTAGPGLRFEHGTIFDRLRGDWLLAHGDVAMAWGVHGVPYIGLRNVTHAELFDLIRLGRLDKSFVFIEPTYDVVFGFRSGDSMHPLGRVSAGERLVKRVYETIRQSRYWNESLLLIVFDEHGGFFDHADPPRGCVPPGDRILRPDSVRHNFKFDQYGVRVPAIVISPWVKKGGVCSLPFDHASIPRTVGDLMQERFFLGERVDRANGLLGLLRDSPREDTPMELSGVESFGEEQEQPPEITRGMRAFFGPLYKARLRGVSAIQRGDLAARLDRIDSEIAFEALLNDTFEHFRQGR